MRRCAVTVDEGYVTLATGSLSFAEMAIDLALSLREHCARRLAVVADRRTRARLAAASVFSHVLELPPELVHDKARKFSAAALSPFARTVFLDADSLVVDALDRVWSAKPEAPFVAVGEMLGPDEDRTHHGFDTRLLCRRFGLRRYLKTNSGLFRFDRASVPALEACARLHREEMVPAGIRWDEVALGVVGGREGFATYDEPGPMLWSEEMPGFDLARPSKPVVHVMRRFPSALWAGLEAGIAARRARAGLPPDSVGIWRRKHLRATVDELATRLAPHVRPLLRLAGPWRITRS